MSITVAGGTKIEWADFTFNPWWGCEKVSPGCAHCYAETLSNRRAPGQNLWGDGHAFRFFGDGHWAEPLKWARLAPAKLGRRPRVFCASMADVFEERPELETHRQRLFRLIAETPELDWLVLTKRPETARDWLAERYARMCFSCDGDGCHCCDGRGAWGSLLPNVWLGVSIENARFTWRADVLREIPATVRFISAEPLLGSLFDDHGSRAPLNLDGIDWLIVGGESGHGARPMRLAWARELDEAVSERRAAGAASTALFVKQLGAVWARENGGDAKGGDWDQWPADLRTRDFPEAAST